MRTRHPRPRVLALWGWILLVGGTASPTLGWGSYTHVWLTREALRSLPQPLPAAKAEAFAEVLSAYSMGPDFPADFLRGASDKSLWKTFHTEDYLDRQFELAKKLADPRARIQAMAWKVHLVQDLHASKHPAGYLNWKQTLGPKTPPNLQHLLAEGAIELLHLPAPHRCPELVLEPELIQKTLGAKAPLAPHEFPVFAQRFRRFLTAAREGLNLLRDTRPPRFLESLESFYGDRLEPTSKRNLATALEASREILSQFQASGELAALAQFDPSQLRFASTLVTQIPAWALRRGLGYLDPSFQTTLLPPVSPLQGKVLRFYEKMLTAPERSYPEFLGRFAKFYGHPPPPGQSLGTSARGGDGGAQTNLGEAGPGGIPDP